uniref:Uncharacterized protein n=1 Tax=Callorhinchus milii TaxID=7868 RepID=A0A4W3KKR6_CALMI
MNPNIYTGKLSVCLSPSLSACLPARPAMVNAHDVQSLVTAALHQIFSYFMDSRSQAQDKAMPPGVSESNNRITAEQSTCNRSTCSRRGKLDSVRSRTAIPDLPSITTGPPVGKSQGFGTRERVLWLLLVA